jgi:hypothetical protein
MTMQGDDGEESATVVMARESLAAAAIVVVAGFAAVVLFPLGPVAGRAVVVAAAVGCATRYVGDWRAGAGVMGLSMLLLVGPLGHGMPSADAGSWSYTPIVILAAVLGSGYRRMLHGPTGGARALSNGSPARGD